MRGSGSLFSQMLDPDPGFLIMRIRSPGAQKYFCFQLMYAASLSLSLYGFEVLPASQPVTKPDFKGTQKVWSSYMLEG